MLRGASTANRWSLRTSIYHLFSSVQQLTQPIHWPGIGVQKSGNPSRGGRIHLNVSETNKNIPNHLQLNLQVASLGAVNCEAEQAVCRQQVSVSAFCVDTNPECHLIFGIS